METERRGVQRSVLRVQEPLRLKEKQQEMVCGKCAQIIFLCVFIIIKRNLTCFRANYKKIKFRVPFLQNCAIIIS